MVKESDDVIIESDDVMSAGASSLSLLGQWLTQPGAV